MSFFLKQINKESVSRKWKWTENFITFDCLNKLIIIHSILISQHESSWDNFLEVHFLLFNHLAKIAWHIHKYACTWKVTTLVPYLSSLFAFWKFWCNFLLMLMTVEDGWSREKRIRWEKGQTCCCRTCKIIKTSMWWVL